MAFEYGESYYGLRAFGSSAGEVKDASASLTATSSIGAVNWKIIIDADASMTATSSVTCSAEKFILEESDRYTYGSGLWGRNVFAGDANLQTVVTATSSVTASCERIRLSGAVSAGASGIAAIGQEVHLGSATASATTTFTAEAIISVTGSAELTSTAALVAVCNRVQSTSGAVSATSGTATIGREKWETITNNSVTWTQIAA